MQFQQRPVLGGPTVLRNCNVQRLALAQLNLHALFNWLPAQKTRASRLQAGLCPAARDNTKLYSSAPSAAAATADATTTGTWKKSSGQSDDMKEACDMVDLSWVLRKGLKLLDTLEVNDSPERFETKIKAGGIMDVVERYSWSGAVTEHKRRDKRRGIHSGRVLRTDSGPQISVEWDDPDDHAVWEGMQVQDCLPQSEQIRNAGRKRSAAGKIGCEATHASKLLAGKS
ncbi:hypothetical protein WJX74_005878 [Apatococcus lobatus]|uniref:Uncharacterized protein n=2 Tax=Apatococcus TaxID=904362 RepID=A0AAW1T6R1_9CHLO